MLPIVDVNVDSVVIVLIVVAIILVFSGVKSGVGVVVFDITVEMVIPLKWKLQDKITVCHGKR